MHPESARTFATATRRGFTLVEILIAALLMTIVGAAIVAFLSALAAGGEARERISDPAIEATLSARRFDTLAPDFRTVLAADGGEALIWANDQIASRSVHLSEVLLLRFDAEAQELLLESVDAEAIANDRSLEQEYAIGHYGSLRDAFEALRTDGLLVREILAEGIPSVEFTEVTGEPGSLDATFSGEDSSARIRLSPKEAEEPLR